jgi:hypothetical protein
MRTVGDAAAAGQGRAGLMGSFAVSLVAAATSLAGSAALVASADSIGRGLELLLVFLVLTGLECVAYVEAVRPWLEGRPVPLRGLVTQAAVLLLVLATLAGGPELAGVGLCAFVAGVFLPNASAIRYRRVNQDLA